MENIVFGIRPVAEAIESGKQIEKIYIRKGAEGQLMTDLKDHFTEDFFETKKVVYLGL